MIRLYVLAAAGFEAFILFLPLGVPLGLASFMCIIELVSFGVRPITLSVRLAANITAGHLLLHLFGSMGLG